MGGGGGCGPVELRRKNDAKPLVCSAKLKKLDPSKFPLPLLNTTLLSLPPSPHECRNAVNMGTHKKEANRKERQGLTGDRMANVKVKGENFYRFVLYEFPIVACPGADDYVQECKEDQDAEHVQRWKASA